MSRDIAHHSSWSKKNKQTDILYTTTRRHNNTEKKDEGSLNLGRGPIHFYSIIAVVLTVRTQSGIV